MIDIDVVSRQSLVNRHMEICGQLNDTYEKKNKDYGNSFEETYFEGFGIVGAGNTLAHKWHRIKNLILNPGTANYEGLEDSLKDMANYLIMTLMCLEKDTKVEPIERAEVNKNAESH